MELHTVNVVEVTAPVIQMAFLDTDVRPLLKNTYSGEHAGGVAGRTMAGQCGRGLLHAAAGLPTQSNQTLLHLPLQAGACRSASLPWRASLMAAWQQ